MGFSRLIGSLFWIPVKPPVVAVEVFPLIILLVIFKVPGADEFKIPRKSLDVPAPVIAQLTILLLVIFTVAVDNAVRPVFWITVIPPDALEEVSVMVLLLIVLVIVPVG